ncbi:MAG TPA: nucleotidyltransferase domain-containing protein, partial [Ktedonobacteraceae bacterium]|nr:nucleotidyltransferase domain-containing protein [Ktedonobacteraceae bacterium]
MNYDTLPDREKPDQYPIRTAEPLSEEFLNALVIELNNDNIVGIILGGSYARNEATPFSDVDIACFVPDSLKPTPKR